MFKNIKILRPILAILLVFIPLYPKFPLSTVANTYVAIRLDDIVVAFALLVFAVDQIKKGLPILKNPLFKLILAYFIAISLSTVTAILIFKTDHTNLLLINALRRVEYMSLAILAANAIFSLKDIRQQFVFVVFTSILVSIYGYGQRYFSFPIVSTMNEEFSKVMFLL